MAVFNLVASFVDFSEDQYVKIYYTANEIIGCSFVSNVFMLLYSYRYKLCYYNKVAVYGLISLNLINFLALSPIEFIQEYYTAITHAVLTPVSLLALILLIKRI